MTRALDTMREINARYHAADRPTRGEVPTLCVDCHRIPVPSDHPAPSLFPDGRMGRACPGPAMIDGRDAREVCACGCHDW